MRTLVKSQHHSLTQPRAKGRFVKSRTNGQNKSDPASTMTLPMSYGLQRILRPQAAFRWILPNLAAITPQYIEMILRGALAGNHVQQWELFDLMFDTWPELTACQQELVYGVLRKKMIYEPFHEEDEPPSDTAVEHSRLVSSAFRNMQPDPARDDNAIEGTIKDILDGWFRGVTVLETIWQISDDKDLGQIMGPKSTFWVHPVCFAFNADGVLGLRDTKPMINTQWPFPSSTLTAQPQPAQLVPFPEHKFLIAIHKAKSGTALGGPLLRPLAWWWCAANFTADWLLNLAQQFGLPLRWANYDPNAPQATVDTICNMLQNMGSTAWAAFPTGTTMELLSASHQGSDHSPQGELLDRADRYARLLILGQTMTGTHGSTGKGGGQAFGQVEKDVKEDRIDAAGKFAAGILNLQLVQSICILNYGDTEECPSVRFLEEEEGKLQDAQRDDVLAKAGLQIGVDFLRKKYGIPEPADGEDTIGGITGGQPPPFWSRTFGAGLPADSGGGQPQDAGGGGAGADGGGDEPAPDKTDVGAKSVRISAGGSPVGHPFRGNQYTAGQIVNVNGSADGKFSGFSKATVVNPHSNSHEVDWSRKDNNPSKGRLYDSQGHSHIPTATVEIDRSQRKLNPNPVPLRFEAFHHQMSPIGGTDLGAKLARISAIKDDAIFARELERLAEDAEYELQPEPPKPPVVNVHVDPPLEPKTKTFTINRPDGTTIQGEITVK